MEELLTFLVKQITGQDKVKIEKETKDSFISYTITLAKEYIPQVIGREGRIIKALRTLAQVLGIKENLRVNVEVKEAQEPTNK